MQTDIKGKIWPGELFREIISWQNNRWGADEDIIQTNPHPEDPGDCDNRFDDGYFARLVVTKKTINNNHP